MQPASMPDSLSGAPHDDQTIPVFSRWFGSWRLSLQRRALDAGQLTRRYDRAAPDWHRTLDWLGVPAAYETLLHSVLAEDMAGLPTADLRVLDCGIGTGALSCALARVLPAPFSLDAIDISPGMLERAGGRLGAAGLDASLRQGDVRALPYAAGAFDLVMTGHVLEHLADPGPALSEMVRVLKPLGALVQLKWRTHRVTHTQAESWLSEGGLQKVRCRSYGSRPISRQLSVACVGTKPL